MPPFWAFLCQRWLGLSYEVSWCWWGALGKSHWSQAQALRAAVLDYGKHPYPAQRPDREKTVLSALVAGKQLVQLCEDLVAQGHLLRKDAAKIEAAVLSKMGADGMWK